MAISDLPPQNLLLALDVLDGPVGAGNMQVTMVIRMAFSLSSSHTHLGGNSSVRSY